MTTNLPVAEADARHAPIACTLDVGDMPARLEAWTSLLAENRDLLRGVAHRRALDDGGLRLEFARNTDVTEIARLAAAEQGCCRFFRFALTIDDRGVALEVRVPSEAQPVLTALFGDAD